MRKWRKTGKNGQKSWLARKSTSIEISKNFFFQRLQNFLKFDPTEVLGPISDVTITKIVLKIEKKNVFLDFEKDFFDSLSRFLVLSMQNANANFLGKKNLKKKSRIFFQNGSKSKFRVLWQFACFYIQTSLFFGVQQLIRKPRSSSRGILRSEKKLRRLGT